MAICKMCHRTIPEGREFCDECEHKQKNQADESYLDSLLSSVSLQNDDGVSFQASDALGDELNALDIDMSSLDMSSLDMSSLDVPSLEDLTPEEDFTFVDEVSLGSDDFELADDVTLESDDLNLKDDDFTLSGDALLESDDFTLSDDDFALSGDVSLESDDFTQDFTLSDEVSFEAEPETSFEQSAPDDGPIITGDITTELLNDIITEYEAAHGSSPVSSVKPAPVPEVNEPDIDLGIEALSFDAPDEPSEATDEIPVFDEAPVEEAPSEGAESDIPAFDEAPEEEAPADEAASDDITSDEAASDDDIAPVIDDSLFEDIPSEEDVAGDAAEDSIATDDITTDDIATDDIATDDITAEDITADDIASDDISDIITEDAGDLTEEAAASTGDSQDDLISELGADLFADLTSLDDIDTAELTEIGGDGGDGADGTPDILLTDIANPDEISDLTLGVDDLFTDAASVDSNLGDIGMDSADISQIMDDIESGEFEKKMDELVEAPKPAPKIQKSLFERLFGNIVEELTPEQEEERRLKLEAEEQRKVQAAELKKKRAAESKEEKAKRKEEEKKEAAEKAKEKAELKKQKKEEAKEKARQRKELMLAEEAENKDEGRINLFGASILVVLLGAIAVIIILGTSLVSYNISMKHAHRNFDIQHYNDAYYDVYGLDIRNDDIDFYDSVLTVMYVNTQLNSYYNFIKLGQRDRALNSLLKGLQRYDKYYQLAKVLNITNDLLYVKNLILVELANEFDLTAEEAYNIIDIEEPTDYAEKINELLGTYEVITE